MRRALLLLSWAILTIALCVVFRARLTAPLSGDEFDYVARAKLIAHGDWLGALGDGYRPPLYPMLLAPFYVSLSDTSAAVVARVWQLALVAGAAVSVLSCHRGNALRSRASAALLALWPPFSYFATLLQAEAWQHLGLTALMLGAVAWRGPIAPAGLVLGALLGVLTLLKANCLVFILPVCTVLWLRFGYQEVWVRMRAVLAALALTLAPWLAFTAAATGEARLTTSLGLNLLQGTGTVAMVADGDPSALPACFLSARGIVKALADVGRVMAPAEHNAYLRDKALLIWSEQPLLQLEFAVVKVVHAYGGSLRGVRDLASLALFAATICASVWLWMRRPRQRKWVVWCAGCTLGGTLTTALFLPDQRFRTFYFDQAALMVLACVLSEGLPRPLLPFFSPRRSSQGAKAG